MPLDDTATRTSRTNYPRLNPKLWLDKVVAYRASAARKKEVDREARELDKMVKTARAEILRAMGSAPVAQCGQFTLTAKYGGAVAPCLTLDDGSKLPWSSIKSLTTTDGRTIPAAAVAGLYGGRENSMSLDVAGG